jgi:hypothetical protein
LGVFEAGEGMTVEVIVLDDRFDYNSLESAGAAAADAAAHFFVYISTAVIQSLSAFSTGSAGRLCLPICSNDTWMLPPLKVPPK